MSLSFLYGVLTGAGKKVGASQLMSLGVSALVLRCVGLWCRIADRLLNFHRVADEDIDILSRKSFFQKYKDIKKWMARALAEDPPLFDSQRFLFH